MKKFLILILSSSLLTVSCSKVRESAGVNRKNIDEFSIIENPPLIIPPDFNLLPPDQLEDKNLDKAKSLKEQISDNEKFIKNKIDEQKEIKKTYTEYISRFKKLKGL